MGLPRGFGHFGQRKIILENVRFIRIFDLIFLGLYEIIKLLDKKERWSI